MTAMLEYQVVHLCVYMCVLCLLRPSWTLNAGIQLCFANLHQYGPRSSSSVTLVSKRGKGGETHTHAHAQTHTHVQNMVASQPK